MGNGGKLLSNVPPILTQFKLIQHSSVLGTQCHNILEHKSMGAGRCGVSN